MDGKRKQNHSRDNYIGHYGHTKQHIEYTGIMNILYRHLVRLLYSKSIKSQNIHNIQFTVRRFWYDAKDDITYSSQ